MRLTKVLLRQNLGWHFKMKWRTQKRRNIQNENTVAHLKEIGLPVIDPYQEFVAEPQIPDPPLVHSLNANSFRITIVYFFLGQSLSIQFRPIYFNETKNIRGGIPVFVICWVITMY